MSSGIQHIMKQSIEWQGDAISVISLGCDRSTALAPQAIKAIQNAEVILGGEHHFSVFSLLLPTPATVFFPSPFSLLAK